MKIVIQHPEHLSESTAHTLLKPFAGTPVRVNGASERAFAIHNTLFTPAQKRELIAAAQPLSIDVACLERDVTWADFKVLAADSAELADALVVHYGLLPVEAEHAFGNLDNNYGEESVLDVLGSLRQIRSPAHPDECSYVRVVVDGLEVAYWRDDEWRDDPACVMGAFLGAAHG